MFYHTALLRLQQLPLCWTGFQVGMDTGKQEDRIRTLSFMKNLFVFVFAVISHTVAYCTALEWASENPGFKRADQPNSACCKHPVPYADLVAKVKSRPYPKRTNLLIISCRLMLMPDVRLCCRQNSYGTVCAGMSHEVCCSNQLLILPVPRATWFICLCHHDKWYGSFSHALCVWIGNSLETFLQHTCTIKDAILSDLSHRHFVRTNYF